MYIRLNSVPSDVHFISIDNLETTMGWIDMLKTKEKIIHFMTAMLQYVPEFYLQSKDFYPKASETSLELYEYKVTDDSEQQFKSFQNSVLAYCISLNDINLSSETEEYVECISSSKQHLTKPDDKRVNFPVIDKDCIPSSRILASNYKGNLHGIENTKCKAVYLRVEQLCSTQLLDVKCLVDKLMDDYGLLEFRYLPGLLCQPPSPMLFAGSDMSSEKYIFRNKWGLFEKKDIQSLETVTPEQDGQTQNVKEIVNNLIQQNNGVTSTIPVLRQKIQNEPNDLMLKLSLAEMYRKQHCFADASSLYKEVIRNFEQTNESVVQGIKLNLALCMYYDKEYEAAFSVCCKHREVEVDKDNAAICIGIETLTSVLSMVLFNHKEGAR